jgi:hypothetical protein
MHLIRIATWVMGSFAALAIGFLAVGFLLPSTWTAEATIEVTAPPEAVFPFLDSAEGWGRWTPSAEEGVESFGPEQGVGSGRRWDDPGYGAGAFQITAIEGVREVRYAVEVEGGAIRIDGILTLEPLGSEGGLPVTRIHWIENGDFGWNPLLGYMAGRMRELQGEQLQASLETLKAEVEAGMHLAMSLIPASALRD